MGKVTYIVKYEYTKLHFVTNPLQATKAAFSFEIFNLRSLICIV